MTGFLKANNKTIYVAVLAIMTVCLLLGYVPGMSAFASWVTPPVALATIFILNAIALFIFPVFGQWLGLSQQEFGTWAAIAGLARKGLIITMFFIGASLSTDVLKSVGVKPLVQGVLLWLVISVGSLMYIV